MDPRVTLQAHAPAASSDQVLAALDTVRPIVSVPATATRAGACAAAALYSMLVRLHPHAIIEGDATLGPNPWGVESLTALPATLTSALPTPTQPHSRDIVLALGDRPGPAHLYIGGGDWTARLGRSPQLVEDGEIGLGLQAAAALAAAEVMKEVMAPLGMAPYLLADALEWNVVDYRRHSWTENPPRRSGDADLVALFGAGSVGSSTGAVLTCVPDVWGRAIIVDPDSFDPARNPIRYPASTGATTGVKAQWIADMLRRNGWRADGFPGRVAGWVALQAFPGLDGLAVSSVDDVDGRRDVADVLARATVSIGVAGLRLRVVLTLAADDGPCPYCQYVDVAPPLSQAAVDAQMTGLSLQRVVAIRVNEEALTGEDVAAAVAAGKIRPETSAELVGRRLHDLVRRAYAQVTVAASGEDAVNVSAPYVSWLAGVLGAAEIVKRVVGLPAVNNQVEVDMKGLPADFMQRAPRDGTRRCICWSGGRRSWSQRLYAGASGEPSAWPLERRRE